jgi:tellurite resistance protein TehA-like permease
MTAPAGGRETGALPGPDPTSIAGLSPGYFALVMATGIIAIGAGQQDLDWLAQPLYAAAAGAYVVLIVLTALRIARYPRRFVADLTSHAKGFAFLTAVAASNVLGSASGIIHGWWDLAWVLWGVSIGFWVLLLYATLIAVVLRAPKPGLGAGINGTWFLLTVSTESIAVLGALLLVRHPDDTVAFALVGAFTLGIVLYLIVMTMVFLRWTFQELEPTEADPPAWIAAGAVAITVLAGSNLLGARAVSPRIDRLAPFIEGMVTLAWATATFWFPLMIAIGIWRHIARRVPLRYHPSYWALVFPLGMYGAATFVMRNALRIEALEWVPKVALVVALIAWAATAIGLAQLGVTTLTARRSRRPGSPSPT